MFLRFILEWLICRMLIPSMIGVLAVVLTTNVWIALTLYFIVIVIYLIILEKVFPDE